MPLTPQWGIRILIGTYYCVHLPLTRENSLANNNDWADQTEQLSVGNRDRMERTLGLTFLTFTSMADDKYFLLPTFAKNINHERREGHIKKQEIKDEESIWDDTATGPLGLTVPMPTPLCDQTQMILTDQSWHAVELRVIGALSLPRFHFARLQMEDFFLKWKNHMEAAINSPLFILSLWFPCVGKTSQRMCSLWLLWDICGLMGDEVLE